MNKHFVKFFSPGTFVDEVSVKEIDSCDVSTAIKMSGDIKERYGARPWGFRFFTKERGENDLDSHVSEESNIYFLGGMIFTLEQMKKINDPRYHTLIQNMEMNDWDRVICNKNSYEVWKPFSDDDVIVEFN